MNLLSRLRSLRSSSHSARRTHGNPSTPVRPEMAFILCETLESRRLMSGSAFEGHHRHEGDSGPAVVQDRNHAYEGSRAHHSITYAISVVASGLTRPTGIAVGRDGNLFFTQVPTPGVAGGSNSVVKLNSETGAQTILHSGEPEPTNIAVDREGNLYWTCKSAGVILEQKPDGTTTKLLTGLDKPTGIAIAPDGKTLYFTQIPTPGVKGVDGGTNTVSKLDIASGAVTVLHRGDPEPADVAVDRAGNVYWTCRTAGVIVEQTPDGTTTVLLRGLSKPVGIAVDASGKNLYFTEVPTPGVKGVDGGTNTVNRVNLRTLERTILHSGDPEPRDITVDRKGNVYWTCSSAGVIVEAKRSNDFGGDDQEESGK